MGALTLSLAILWATRGARSKTSAASSISSVAATIDAREKPNPLPSVSTVVRQSSSAYHARLFADAEGVVIVTQTGFGLVRDGKAMQQHSVDLGPVAARHGSSIVFWRAGWLREISLSGGDDRPLAALPRAPRHLLASDSRLAWVEVDADKASSLRTIADGEVRVVRTSRDSIGASVLRDAVVYSVLQGADGSWRIGSIDLDGQRQLSTTARQGRPPAMLALGPDGVYFYAGPERGLRRLSFDLDREDTVASQVICSPVVVSNRAICAQVGGLFYVPAASMVPRFLASEREGPITALAATDERIFWIADAGQDRMVVRSILLPGL